MKFLPMKNRAVLVMAMMLALVSQLQAQEEEKQKTMEIYGFIMMDAGYNFNQIQNDWFDVVRPTKLPSYKNQYGTDGNFYFSVRQTRLGFKNYLETPLGLLKTQFEFEMFGTGVDAGQTTIRLRHAYAELGKFGVGQTWSPFMDIDVFPNTVEYWGPTGMAFFRNIQIRYMPIQGDTRLTIALERPGGSAVGWGLNLSTNVKIGKDNVFRGQFLYGSGIENYMNDAPADVGVKEDPANPAIPLKGETLPVTGIVAFLDHSWSSKLSTSIGYSSITIDNTDGATADAFKHGDYAIVNLLCTPVPNMMFGGELQYGKRTNFKDGFSSNITKLQFSFKYNFSHSWYK